MRESVTVNLIPSLPEEPFRNGVGAYEGVVMHSTDVYGDTADGERHYETTHFGDAFVHTFSDDTGTVQVASYQYKAWGAGRYANERFLHNELCQVRNDGNEEAAHKFKDSYENWVMTAAEQLAARSLGVTPAASDGSGTLWRHSDVTKILGATTHDDPDGYLAEWGKTWDNVVNDVTYLYNALTQTVTPPASEPDDPAPPPAAEEPAQPEAPAPEAPAPEPVPTTERDGRTPAHVWYVRAGETWDKIGAEFGIPGDILFRYNGSADIAEGCVIGIPHMYRLQSGDSLLEVAKAAGYPDLSDIVKLNRLDTDLLSPGQVIYL